MNGRLVPVSPRINISLIDFSSPGRTLSRLQIGQALSIGKG